MNFSELPDELIVHILSQLLIPVETAFLKSLSLPISTLYIRMRKSVCKSWNTLCVEAESFVWKKYIQELEEDNEKKINGTFSTFSIVAKNLVLAKKRHNMFIDLYGKDGPPGQIPQKTIKRMKNLRIDIVEYTRRWSEYVKQWNTISCRLGKNKVSIIQINKNFYKF